MARFDRHAICGGSPYERFLRTTDAWYDWIGCSASTFSDHTLATERGWWALRARTEGILKGWLPVLAHLITEDARHRAFDYFVKSRFSGKVAWSDGEGPQKVNYNAYTLVLLDPTLSPPEPYVSKQLANGIARARKNFDAVFPDPNSSFAPRLQKQKDRSDYGWYSWSDYPYKHRDPSETAGMKAALADMRAKYSDVYGPNLKTEASKYWVAAQNLLNFDPMGCPYQESDGNAGCDVREMPFKLSDLYYIDGAEVIQPSEKLKQFLDLWAPGWDKGMKAPVLIDPKEIAKLKFSFGQPPSEVPSSRRFAALAAGAAALGALVFLTSGRSR
jgi:hypothetical protein